MRTPVLQPARAFGCRRREWLAGKMAEDMENRDTWVSEFELETVASSMLLTCFLCVFNFGSQVFVRLFGKHRN